MGTKSSSTPIPLLIYLLPYNSTLWRRYAKRAEKSPSFDTVITQTAPSVTAILF
jgi:hypothetical protein